jgi:sulfide:quinone oxidoreductase
MDRFSVVIAGGGVAAIEGLLRLRRLAGDALKVTLLAPNEEFAFRALSVKEPFALGTAERHPLSRIVRDTGADWVRDTLAWVDPDGQVVHTGEGAELAYDALLVAVGARTVPVYEHATTFRDAEADALLSGLVEDIEGGYTKRVAFLAPAGPVYELPLYELALMTAERAKGMGMDDVELTVVTPDPAPLSIFGTAVADAVGGLLERAGIAVHAGTEAQVPAAGTVLLGPGGGELAADRVVALPRIEGPGVRGLPGVDGDGFVAIDAHCAVPGSGGRVFAAGDVASFPVKHGGLGSEQADAAAAAIAFLAGSLDAEPEPFQPLIRGVLLTGAAPLYMSAQLVGGGSLDSEVGSEPLWPSGDKVAAEELGRYLAGT